MNVTEAVATKLDIREFSDKPVPAAVKRAVLEAARLTASSRNTQHWRFILVQDPANLNTLASDSISGAWVKGSNFAVIVNIDPQVPGSTIDAGRVVQDMQLAAWDQGVASGVFTRMKPEDVRRDFGIPDNLDPAIVVGLGYPRKKILGRKNRKPLSEVAYLERYGNKLELPQE